MDTLGYESYVNQLARHCDPNSPKYLRSRLALLTKAWSEEYQFAILADLKSLHQNPGYLDIMWYDAPDGFQEKWLDLARYAVDDRFIPDGDLPVIQMSLLKLLDAIHIHERDPVLTGQKIDLILEQVIQEDLPPLYTSKSDPDTGIYLASALEILLNIYPDLEIRPLDTIGSPKGSRVLKRAKEFTPRSLYQDSQKNTYPMRFLQQDGVFYCHLDDLAATFRSPKLPKFILNRDPKYINTQLYLHHSQYYVDSSTALDLVSICQKRSSPRWHKWVSQNLGVVSSQDTGCYMKAGPEPGIYLVNIGSVAQLRERYYIDDSFPDSSHVYKFGMSKNVQTRERSHKSRYKSVGVNVALVYYRSCALADLRRLEAAVAERIQNVGCELEYPGENELAVMDREQLGNLIQWIQTMR